MLRHENTTIKRLFSLIFLAPLAFGALATESRAADEIKLRPREAELEAFPCDSCHDGSPAKKAPPGEPPEWADAHDMPELKHMKRIKNCSTCHHMNQPNNLFLADGTRISFDESTELCAQCHGNEFKDWRQGVHGRYSGNWRGPKEKWACTACHNPHNPEFRSMTAVQPPVPPRPTLPKKPEGQKTEGKKNHE